MNVPVGTESFVAWIVLIVAGLLEVAWAAALSTSEGFTRPVPTVVFLGTLAASMFGLARATETIPLGTAYGIWVGIGAVGAALVGIFRDGDPAGPARIGFLVLLVVSIVGLRVSGTS